jgi:FkbM family methyltransferase
MRIFVDVGAHYGETLDVALDPVWGFDRVFSLEPSAPCHRVLSRFRDPRLIVEQIGLSNKNDTAILYGAGLLGGSVYAEKRQLAEEIEQETIRLEKASEWLAKNIPSDSEVFLKLNCEGSEVDILADLLDSGAISQVKSVYVDFDIKKVAGQEGRQAEIENRLTRAGVRFISTDQIGYGANRAVCIWLDRDCPRVPASPVKRVAHRFQTYAPMYDRVSALLRAAMPRRVYWWLGRRFGRMARSAQRAR